MTKASEATAKESDSFLPSFSIPDFAEKQFKKYVDCAIVMTTCDLWDCWDDVKEAETVQARDEEDSEGFLSYRDRDDDSYRSCADASTIYSNFDDFSYLTRDEESLYSQYSRYTDYTGREDECESYYSRCSTRRSENEGGDGTTREDDEEETNFKRIMAALKNHAVALGISEVELLERLEAQQEQLRRDKDIVGDQEGLETVMEAPEQEDETDGSDESDHTSEEEKNEDGKSDEENKTGSDVGEDLEQRSRTALARYLIGMRSSSHRLKSTRQINKQKRANRSTLHKVKVVG